MKKEKNKNQSIYGWFSCQFCIDKKIFHEKGLGGYRHRRCTWWPEPSLRALAASGEVTAGEMGEWKASTCQGCTSWCSNQVYVIDGRAVKVRGNPNSKVNGEKVVRDRTWRCSRCMTRTALKPP